MTFPPFRYRKSAERAGPGVTYDVTLDGRPLGRVYGPAIVEGNQRIRLHHLWRCFAPDGSVLVDDHGIVQCAQRDLAALQFLRFAKANEDD